MENVQRQLLLFDYSGPYTVEVDSLGFFFVAVSFCSVRVLPSNVRADGQRLCFLRNAVNVEDQASCTIFPLQLGFYLQGNFVGTTML